MAQSTLTVTPPTPTPPTNMSCTGATGPNPPNYTKATYTDLLDNTKFDTAPPPYFDDGTAGPVGVFAANAAPLASGAGATAGGTEGTYPGVVGGVVPASTSVAHEGAGTEVTVTNPGNVTYTFPVGTFDTSKSYSTGPALTAAAISAGPNASHASSLSPPVAPTFTAVTAAVLTSGPGTTTVTATGTGFTPGCRIWVDNVERTTTFVSATSLTAVTPKKANPGVWNVDVKLAGVAVLATRTLTWT